MKVLITGGSGLLGKSLLETRPNSFCLNLTWKKNIFIQSAKDKGDCIWYFLDIRDRASVHDLFEIVRPDIVVHCAAIGSVDFAQQYYQEVFETNVTGLANVIDAANGYKAKMVYISSNAVFSGNEPPYNEESPLNPVNDYGVIKQIAERTIRDTAKKWLIVRPFLLYGWPYLGGRGNWASNIVQKLRNGMKLKMVDDHIWQPTYAPDCAAAIWELARSSNGIFNVAQPERITLYEFALKICDVFELNKELVNPIESSHFSSIAKRPKDTSFDLVKLSEAGIMLSSVKGGLEKMKKAEK